MLRFSSAAMATMRSISRPAAPVAQRRLCLHMLDDEALVLPAVAREGGAPVDVELEAAARRVVVEAVGHGHLPVVREISGDGPEAASLAASRQPCACGVEHHGPSPFPLPASGERGFDVVPPTNGLARQVGVHGIATLLRPLPARGEREG